jgi:YHS domain-containing protein
MTRARSLLRAALLLACAASGGFRAHATDDASDSRGIPAPFAPLEYLVGEWKGQAIPKDHTAQQFRGWTEKHAWAWIFTKGKPTGLSFTMKESKILASGKLTFDPKQEVYRLEGKEPGARGKSIVFEGKLDSSGKHLVLDQTHKEGDPPPAEGELRISFRPNANFLRYTMTHDRKAPGAAVFARTTEVGVTKEGETFAAGSAATERAKCIVTGGAATMTVSFEGKSFPLCCSGCLGEFNDNPQKYVKKATLMLANQAGKPQSSSASTKKRGRDDAFAGDIDESTESARPAAKAKKTDSPGAAKAAKADDADDDSTDSAKSKDKSDPKKKDAAQTPAAKAATLLRLGRALERAGKTDQALANYKQIVKDLSKTPSAKTASERIKALEPNE